MSEEKRGPSQQGPEQNDGREHNTTENVNFSLRDGWNELTENEKLILAREAHESDKTSKFEIRNVNGFDLIINDVAIINPALDFYKNKLILTLPFIWNKPLFDDDKAIRGHKPEATNFTLILPEKDLFLLNENQLVERGLFAKPPSGVFPKRWSNKSFLDFLEHDRKIDPYKVFKEIKEKYDFYMDYGDRQSSITTYKAAYVIMTYFHPLFNYLGYDKLEGDTSSGKSKSAQIDTQLCFNAISSVDASAAAIYRVIQERRSTLIVDEFEGYSVKDPDKLQILTILNAGFQKGLNIPRMEMKGSKASLLESSPFGPKTIAAIDPVYETLRNRSHIIRSVRTLDKEKSNREIDANDPEWQSVRDDLYLLLVNYYREMKELSNKKYDNWGLESRDLNKAKPILTVIEFIRNYAGQDSEKITDDIKKFFEGQKEENKEASTESFEATIINRLEIFIENVISSRYQLKRNNDDEDQFKREMAKFANENVEISIPVISEAIAMDSGIDTDGRGFNKISYSKKISHKLKTMNLKKNPRIAHNNITIFDCSLSDIRNAKIRYGLFSGQSILPNLPIQPIQPNQSIPKNEQPGIESIECRGGIEEKRGEGKGIKSR
ncbi:MAG: hypothetical protein ACP5OC_09075, partial [Thermoplasmata archaeon]